MINLTDKEYEMLFNIAENNYANGDPSAEVWSDCLWDQGPYQISVESVAGRVSALVQKGLVHPQDQHCPVEDRSVVLTTEGVSLYRKLKAEKNNG